MRKSSLKGFTLIELLIVVAIIAILAAIAVPNFLEAQTRAKVARVKNDMRALSVGMESYRVDVNKYPCRTVENGAIGYPHTWSGGDLFIQYMVALSTPISYLSSVAIRDPFQPKDLQGAGQPQWFPKDSLGTFFYTLYGHGNGEERSWGEMMRKKGNYSFVPDIDGFCIASYGPDRQYGNPEYAIFEVNWNATAPWPVHSMAFPNAYYDSTNGTMSKGDIARYGGEAPANPS